MNSEFWLDFGSNGLATLLGAIIGIPIAFYIERLLESSRYNKRKDLNLLRINNLLYRTMVQITNLNFAIENTEKFEDKNFLIFASFPEVEIIETLHKLLTDLEADWEILLALDIVISDTKTLISLLNIYKEIFSLIMSEKISNLGRYTLKFNDEIQFKRLLTVDAIEDFRKLVKERYPNYIHD